MSAASQRQMERELHYAVLKNFNGADPVHMTVRTSGSAETAGGVAHAKQFWRDVFQDFPELRRLFPDYADQFGPYAEPAAEIELSATEQMRMSIERMSEAHRRVMREIHDAA